MILVRDAWRKREVQRILNGAGGLPSGLVLTQLQATMDYAVGCVERINETKRPRRKPKGAKP
jgi:hypothetical protein